MPHLFIVVCCSCPSPRDIQVVIIHYYMILMLDKTEVGSSSSMGMVRARYGLFERTCLPRVSEKQALFPRL